MQCLISTSHWRQNFSAKYDSTHTVALLNFPEVPRGMLVTMPMPIICSVGVIFLLRSTWAGVEGLWGIKPLNSKMRKIDQMKC